MLSIRVPYSFIGRGLNALFAGGVPMSTQPQRECEQGNTAECNVRVVWILYKHISDPCHGFIIVFFWDMSSTHRVLPDFPRS